nr:immunoglobulin light chain junction region [Macaca mulatta]MOV77411.1 immunoglobulin light chain junction region [Macaca mulatta]
CQHYNDLLSF